MISKDVKRGAESETDRDTETVIEIKTETDAETETETEVEAEAEAEIYRERLKFDHPFLLLGLHEVSDSLHCLYLAACLLKRCNG